MNDTKRKPISLTLILCALALPLSGVFANEGPGALWECQGVMVRQEGPTSASVGKEIRYRIRVANEGDCEVEGALLTDFIPRKTNFKYAKPEPTDYPGMIQETPVPKPVDKIEWRNVHLIPATRPVEQGGDFEVYVEVLGPAGRIMTNTVCLEHPKTGRICDTLDTYVKP